MSSQLGLFDDDPTFRPPPAVAPAAVPATLQETAGRLPPGLRLGTSSWSFPGWKGIVYDRTASQALLAREGLAAYAAHPLLRTVGVDRTWYRPVTAEDFRGWAEVVPGDFRFLVKAERRVTSPTDPDDTSVRGRNPRFLDAAYAADVVVAPLVEGLGPRAGPLLFQFSPIPPNLVGGRDRFADTLHAFLSALPRGPLYAVELRTPALLGDRYVEALSACGVAHGFVVHPAMASLADQLRLLRPTEQPALVVRWMLHAGLRYEAARDRYAPFDRIVDEDVASRDAITAAALDAILAERDVFVVANNKAEGSAPRSVFRLAERIAGWRAEGVVREAEGPLASPAVALRWIVEAFERVGTPHQAVGGLAARAWGAHRPLVDLDFYVPASAVEPLVAELGGHLTRPPAPFEDARWRLTFMQARRHGTTVEIGVAEGASYRDAHTGAWVAQAVDFGASERREVLGVPVDVMPRAQLLAYKRALDRAVDRRDVAEVEDAADAD